MNIEQTAKFVTLDWDNINLGEALQKFNEICDSPNTRKAVLSKSARKGYHVRVWLFFRVRLVNYRLNFGDDARRILHDLLNRPDHIHDILWSRKTIHGNAHVAKRLITYG